MTESLISLSISIFPTRGEWNISHFVCAFQYSGNGKSLAFAAFGHARFASRDKYALTSAGDIAYFPCACAACCI